MDKHDKQLCKPLSSFFPHSSDSEGCDWRRQQGIQFSSPGRKHASVYTARKLSLSSHHYQLDRCTEEMQNTKFYWWKTPDKKQHQEDWSLINWEILEYQLNGDMFDLMPALLICLMAVQTNQLDGKFLKLTHY